MYDESLTIQQKEQIMNYLMKCYRKSYNRIKKEESMEVRENHTVYLHDKATCLLVDEALQELKMEERRIILNDYLYLVDEQWYMGYYTKNTYLQIKHKAVDQFLRCLHT